LKQGFQSKHIAVAAACCAASMATGAFAQDAVAPVSSDLPPRIDQPASEVELLRQQLAAQQAINQQLRRRVDALEGQLAQQQSGGVVAQTALDANAAQPPADLEDPDATSAIEEALGSKGLVVLRPGGLRLTPAFSWTKAGPSDSYGLSLGASTGLPGGVMLSVGLPYRKLDTPIGSNSGHGDLSLGLSKRLLSEAPGRPSLVASLGYSHDSGKDPWGDLPLGSGFRSVSAGLSAVKRISPLAFYGSLSYGHTFAKNIALPDFEGRLAPRNGWGAGMGVSLAATPDVSLDVGLSMSFGRGTRVTPLSGEAFTTPSSRVGYLNFGTGVLLSRNLLLNVSVGAGVTKEASDFTFSVALPYRF
jgi:opacity protein-like surface antigen